jgi:RHS repeat-associated protein
VPNIVRYAGGAIDQSTGLTKYGQRYYNPALGAFTQQDANQILANPSNGNLYAYAGDNPANGVDPTGYDVNPIAVGYWTGIWTAFIYGCAPGAVAGFIGGAAEGPGTAVGEAAAGCLYNSGH